MRKDKEIHHRKLTSADVVDGVDDIHTRGNLAEHGVLRRGRLVPEVQEAVVHSVDEELRSTRVGLTSVGLETTY